MMSNETILDQPTLHSLRRWAYAMAPYYGETEEVLEAKILAYAQECPDCPRLLAWDWMTVKEETER